MRRSEFVASLLAGALPAAHQQAAMRRRRICVQFDAADHRHVKLAPDAWLRYIFRYMDEPGSQIDMVLWDIGIPEDDEQIVRWRAQGFDWNQALIAECRRRKLEVFWNHRLSEVEISPTGGLEMERLNPTKAAHPDWVIRSWWWQGLWNLAASGLRDFKIAELRKLVETRDLDGLQIDFARHIPCLPPGRQWELREHATTFMRMLRRMTMEVAAKRGKPLLLSAKVPETLRGCRIDGFDIEVWARENLVDILTLGSRTMTVDVEDFRRLCGRQIKLIPCLDDHHATDGYRYPPVEFFRGVAWNWLQQGADSVCTFNWSAAPKLDAEPVGGRVAPDSQRIAYHEIGLLETLSAAKGEAKPKLFVVERRGGYPWAEGYHNRNDHMPLPAQLTNHGSPLKVAIRIYEQPAAAKLRLVLFQARIGDVLEVAWNGQILGRPESADEWKDGQIFSPLPQPNSGGKGVYTVDPNQKLLRLEYQLPAIRRGANEVSIRVMSRPPYRIGEDIQVEKVEVWT